MCDKFFVHLIALLECQVTVMTEMGFSDTDIQPVKRAIECHQKEEDLGGSNDEDVAITSYMMGGVLLGHPTYDIADPVDTQALTDIARRFMARSILIDF
jgi:hypothetical protein